MDQVSKEISDESGRKLDEVFHALADQTRRDVVRVLDDREEMELGELARAVADDQQSLSNVKTALIHRHLPRLADAGIISCADDYACELADSKTPVPILEAAHRSSTVLQ